ncbi:transcription factor TFIIIB component B'' homolog [Lates japonicus]|uniref:Transcription factor TFIIIB component B'' homolog n=1 Tax=Lates japonicus TaxID=270547 RepID=A0AAD3MCY0_LATJO|nr:transcription factor TFIIIB component B'' homolog [Lates japonicus]
MESAICYSSLINGSVFLQTNDKFLNRSKCFAGQDLAFGPMSVRQGEQQQHLRKDNQQIRKPVNPPEMDGNDQSGEGTSSSAAVQRRKRFSVKPKVAPGRPSNLARTPKSPVKAVSETPVEVPDSDLDKPGTSSQTRTTAAPQGLQSPKRRRHSEESKQPKVQPKPTPISSDLSGPSAVPLAEESLEQTDLPTDSGKQLDSKSGSQVKEVPPRPPDKVPLSLPDKETVEISEKAKTLVSSKGGLSVSSSAFSLSRLLNDPSDLQRLAKAQKLRELLRQERHKEKKLKKAKARIKEYTLDPAKMTMRDLIRYLPVSNPMTSSLEDSAQENETVVPSSPVREESPERAQEPEVPEVPEVTAPRDEEEEVEEEEQEEALMVPQVKVAEDGSLIIDEQSLTVEVQRAKGPNPAQDRDPIFERGSTTTYSSFRKGTYSKPWSSEETDMFFLAISMVGTDFSMICQLFPHRARSEIKNKFKKEERENAWRIDKAFRERRKLDIEYFSKLLEKILEVQKNRKKLKSLAKKNSPKKRQRKTKGKKAAKKLSDVEDDDEEDENQVPDLEDEEEGEKENEDLCNEGGSPVSKPKRQRKRKTRQDALNEEPSDKKNKTGENSNDQGEACVPEDTEAALSEDHTSSDMSEKTENVNASKDTAIKPAKLSRGRAPNPLLPLGRKWGKKPPPPSTKAKHTEADNGDETVNKDSSPSRQANKRKSASGDISSVEEDASVEPPRPTRYGRVPKPTKPLTYSARGDAHTSDTVPVSPVGSTASAAKSTPKCTAKRGRTSKQQSAQESKKPKLVTLRASRSEYSDEEDEKLQHQEEIEEEDHPACSPSKDSIAPVFVPASLRSPRPVISEVEETMEELDILANMPDVLGISQDALCPDSSCEQAQNETGTAEPCEHQLDLLVDVIDFLSSEHAEVSEDESYNEAAQTLLTIGNLTHLPQSAQNQPARQDHITGTASCAQSTDNTQSELTDSSKYSGKAPQTRRGRILKPKPNVGRSGRPPQPQPVKNTTPAEADPGTRSEGVNASISHSSVSKLQPDILEPVEGAIEYSNQESPPNDDGALLGCLTQIIEQLSQHDSAPNDAGSSQGCVPQVPDNSSQDTSTLSTDGNHPSLTIFPDMLSEQAPSDPEETFFILALTEIPVCSSGEVVDSAAEPLPYLPVADVSIQQQSSVPGESLAAAGDGSLSSVSEPMSIEESGEMGLISIKDTEPNPAAYIDSVMENVVDPHETTSVQLPKLSETEENNDETEITPSTQRLETGRRGKQQVKSSTTRKKQVSKTLVTSTQDSELPGPSREPEASDATAKTGDEVVTEPQKRSGDNVNTEKEPNADEKGPEDSSGTQTQTTKTRGTRIGNRKPKDFHSFLSDMNSTAPSSYPSPGKASSKGPKVKAPHTRTRSTITPVASTSHSVTLTPDPTQLSEETHSTSSATSPTSTEVGSEQTTEHNQLSSDPAPSTSQCSAEVSASQQSDCVESSSTEEEPTSVSQYFLSDIFTDVEEQ